ncbi:MAG: PAS domain S-box protein [Deltaproteobacteria bacterium]|nr:PAS domain S-box protein [Deltaproteobacteria bacterium]
MEKENDEKGIEQRVRLEAILKAMVDQVFAFDSDGRFTYCHTPPSSRLYLEPKQFLGRTCAQVMPPHVQEVFAEAMEENRAGRVAEYDYQLLVEGENFWFHARQSPLLDGHIFAGAVAVVRDISNIKRAQEQEFRLEAKLQQAQKLESLGVLAGGVAHDFNNLIMSVLGFADLALQEPSLSQELIGHLEQIRKTSYRATEFTRQLLAYTGRGRLSAESLDLSFLVLDTADMLKVNLPGHAKLELDCPAGLPRIQGDVTQLRQVAMNLISNAAESLAEQAGQITIGTYAWTSEEPWPKGTLVSEDPPSGEYIMLKVADTGLGMDEPTRQRIFEPFFSTKLTGSGIGLAAVMGIMRSHKGFILMESKPGQGTTFHLGFPVSDAADSD